MVYFSLELGICVGASSIIQGKNTDLVMRLYFVGAAGPIVL